MESFKPIKTCHADNEQEGNNRTDESVDLKQVAGLMNLPDELLFMIMKEVSSMDIVSLACTCRRFNAIICDWKLLSYLNFHHEVQLKLDCLKKILTFRMLADQVVTVDLTSCYWLTSSTLLGILSRLKNVENVLVADTCLSSIHLKQLLSNSTKIKRLSWTWNTTMTSTGVESALLRLVFLYLVVRNQREAKAVSHFISKCTNLQELWVIPPGIHQTMQCNFRPAFFMPHLESAYPSYLLEVSSGANVVHSWQHCSLVGEEEQCATLKSLYMQCWNEAVRVIKNKECQLARLSVQNTSGDDVCQVLNKLRTLTSLSINLPPDHSPTLLMSQPLLRELGLCSSNGIGSVNFCLNASHCPKITRLCLPTNALTCNRDAQENVNNVPRISLGVRRVSRIIGHDCHNSPNVNTPFQIMVRSTPLVQEFEIGTCDGKKSFRLPESLQWDFSSLVALTKWPHLTSLTLANLPIQEATFLEKVTRGCPQLQKLCLENLGLFGKCIYLDNLLKALPFCTSLLDFRWVQNNVGYIRQLWDTLSLLTTLQRVSVVSAGTSSIDDRAVIKFVDVCPNLVFLYAVTGTTKKKCSQIKSTIISKWGKERPALVIWLGQASDMLKDLPRLPAVHVGEMVHHGSLIVGAPNGTWHYLKSKYFGEF